MNTNGRDDSPAFGKYCYDYMDTRNPVVSSDYLGLLGAYTFKGQIQAEAGFFCGIFDGLNINFPGITSIKDFLVFFSCKITLKTDQKKTK